MKRAALACAMLALALFARAAGAQVSLVPASHPVYDWLLRQRVEGNAPDFSHEMLPLSRGTVESLLEEIATHSASLGATDRSQLAAWLREFSVDTMRVAQHDTYLQGWDSTVTSSVKRKLRLLLSNREPYLYAHVDTEMNAGVYFRWADGVYSSSTRAVSTTEKYGYATLSAFGTLYDRFGFDTYGTNAYTSGSGQYVRTNVQYAAANVPDSTKGSVFFAQAYASWRYRHFGIDVGNGAPRIGEGAQQAVIIRPEAPNFPWVRLTFDSKRVQFQQYYAALQGYAHDTTINGTPGIATQVVPQRWMMMHRLQVRPFDALQLGVTETITYSNRPFDLTFVNPVYPLILAKSDAGNNSNGLMIYLDAVYRPFKRVETYATLGIDDMYCLSDIFKSTGNRCNNNNNTKLLYLAGGTIALKQGIDLQGEYLRVEPYFGLHLLPLNGMQQNGYSLLTDVGPNADQYWFAVRQWLPGRSWVRASFAFTRHGLNVADSAGTILQDVGGSINSNYTNVSPVLFLAGDVNEYATFDLDAHWEPWRGVGLDVSYQDRNVTKGTQVPSQRIFTLEGNFGFYPLSFLFKIVGLAP